MEKIIINNQIEVPYSDYDCSNVLTYIVEPERDPSFELNADQIVHKYIPKLTIKVNYLSSAQYIALVQNINTPHFKVKYYDYELMKVVERDMYCSDNSLSDVNAYSSDFKGAVSVTLTFVCSNGFKDYNELKNLKYDFKEEKPTNLTARFYFSSNDNELIKVRTLDGNLSEDGSWNRIDANYDKKLLGDITGGQNCLVVGSALDDKGQNRLYNKYQGMILTAGVSQNILGSNGYKINGDTTFVIDCVIKDTNNNKVFIEFDRASELYGTEIRVNGKTYINNDYMIGVPLNNGANSITVLSLNKPNQYCKINAIFTSLVIDFVSGKDLISFKKGTKATDENGKAYYSLNSSYASLNIFDKLDIISSLAKEKKLTNDTYVEIYLGKDKELSNKNLIGNYYTKEFKYSGTNYDKKIDIDLKDPTEFLNDYYLSKLEKNVMNTTVYNGSTLLNYIVKNCSKNSLTLEMSDKVKKEILSLNHCNLTKLGANFYEQLNALCTMLNIYMWSNADGKIRLVEGQ